jgi:hypothetical protein
MKSFAAATLIVCALGIHDIASAAPPSVANTVDAQAEVAAVLYAASSASPRDSAPFPDRSPDFQMRAALWAWADDRIVQSASHGSRGPPEAVKRCANTSVVFPAAPIGAKPRTCSPLARHRPYRPGSRRAGRSPCSNRRAPPRRTRRLRSARLGEREIRCRAAVPRIWRGLAVSLRLFVRRRRTLVLHPRPHGNCVRLRWACAMRIERKPPYRTRTLQLITGSRSGAAIARHASQHV